MSKTKLSLINRPPIEEFYKVEIATNTIRYEKIPYAKQKLIALFVFGGLCVLIFQYKIFPTVNLASKNCELWQGIDLIFLLFYFIFIFPMLFVFSILFLVFKQLRHLNRYHERLLNRTGYLEYRVLQKITDNKLFFERLKLLFKIFTLLCFIGFLISSAIKYDESFFGMNSAIKHPLNPFTLQENSQISQKLCIEKQHPRK